MSKAQEHDETETETEAARRPLARNRRQVRVSEEVYQEIQKRARPLVDTVDDVLRRVFGLPEREDRKSEE